MSQLRAPRPNFLCFLSLPISFVLLRLDLDLIGSPRSCQGKTRGGQMLILAVVQAGKNGFLARNVDFRGLAKRQVPRADRANAEGRRRFRLVANQFCIVSA